MIVVPPAELDLLTAPMLVSDLRRNLTAGPQHVVIDMAKVTFLGAKGIHALLQACEEAEQAGVGLQLRGVHSNALVSRVLNIARAGQLFDTIDP